MTDRAHFDPKQIKVKSIHYILFRLVILILNGKEITFKAVLFIIDILVGKKTEYNIVIGN